MKTIKYLVLALALVLAPTTRAATTVRSVSQELYAVADAANGNQAVEDGPHTASGGIPSSLSVSASVATTEGQYTEASCSASQSVGLAGLAFPFSGEVSTHQFGVYPLTVVSAFHYIDFTVSGQAETITLDLSQFSIVSLDDGKGPFYYFALFNATRTQVITWGLLYTPQTQQILVSPGSYSLQAGVEIFDNTYLTDDRSAAFADTISFTNLLRGVSHGHPIIRGR